MLEKPEKSKKKDMKNLFVSWMAPKFDQYGHHVIECSDGDKVHSIDDIRDIRNFVAEHVNGVVLKGEDIVVLSWKWMD